MLVGCENESNSKRIFKNIFKNKKERVLGNKDIKEKTVRLDNYFTSLHKKKALNGVVLVAKGKQVIFEKAYGFADSRKKKPLSVKAGFQIASVSKQFTAAAILLLKQQGKLSLEDSVQKFYPEFPYKGITIRRLLTHNSGLPNYTYFCDKMCDRKKIIDNQTVLRLMSSQKPPMYFTPGKKYDYSNTGYIVLAAIVEKVSNMKFEDFMLKNIFVPAHMDKTIVYNHGAPVVVQEFVDGYSGNRKAGKTYLDGVVGDKGVYSNVQDMYKWNRILYTDSLITQKLIQKAYEPAYKVKNKKDNYGFGWRIKDYKKGKVVWHSGWWGGYKSMFLRNLEDETVIIVLANSLSGHLKAEEILDVYYDIN